MTATDFRKATVIRQDVEHTDWDPERKKPRKEDYDTLCVYLGRSQVGSIIVNRIRPDYTDLVSRKTSIADGDPVKAVAFLAEREAGRIRAWQGFGRDRFPAIREAIQEALAKVFIEE